MVCITKTVFLSALIGHTEIITAAITLLKGKQIDLSIRTSVFQDS